MSLKIYIPKTNFFVEADAIKRTIFINDMIDWSVKTFFEKLETDISLDENGDVFEPLLFPMP